MTLPSDDPLPGLRAQLRPQPALPGPRLAECLVAMREQRQMPAENPVQRIFRLESTAWARRQLTAEAPFAERWTAFWANHLCVSRRAGQTTAFLGHYEREVIRPHAFGRYEALLLAAYRHPAMLFYLDQANSIGPDSPAGQRRGGLNENLAREALELHSVTPTVHYTQADVAALARLLSGFSVGRGEGEPEGFVFRERTHQPGPKTLLGREYPEGLAGAEQALRDLANHPATRAALARKLARHFVADTPPPAAVARIAAALADSGGDLAAAGHAVLACPEAWQPLGKLRSGQDWCLATLRAQGIGAEGAGLLLQWLARLGQPLWSAPAPTGWSDDAAEWGAPEQLMRRLDLAGEAASRATQSGRIEPSAVAEALLGPLARAETVQAVRRAGAVREAILLLLACPEAQRR